MAEMGAHSALSGAIAVAIYRMTIFPFEVKTAMVIIFSSLGHLVLDLFPHGHTQKMWKEMVSAVFIIPVVVLISIFQGGLDLFFLVGVSLFFGNLFDGLLFLADKIKTGLVGRILEKIQEFNLWIHWFVRSSTFMARYDVRQKTSHEIWKEKDVYSWKYGWYNFIPLIFGIAAFCTGLLL